MNYEHAKQLAINASDEQCVPEDKVALREDAAPLNENVGSLSAGEALFIYQSKAQSAKRAGVDVHGIDQLLAGLAACQSEETVLIFYFENATRAFIMFVAEADESFIGCTSVPHRFPDPDVDWSTGAPVRRKKETSEPPPADVRAAIVTMDIDKKPEQKTQPPRPWWRFWS
jgi:hypothetical protein